MKPFQLASLSLVFLSGVALAQGPKPQADAANSKAPAPAPPPAASAKPPGPGAAAAKAPAKSRDAKAGAPSPPESPMTDPAVDVGTEAASANSMFSGFMDPFDYDTRGRRDPFVIPTPDKAVEQGAVAGPLLPLQKFDLGQLRLIGIIWDVKRPKAMIKDPTGATHVVGTNTKVGPRNGYIAVIREGEMVVVETQEQDGRLVSSAQVVKIAR